MTEGRAKRASRGKIIAQSADMKEMKSIFRFARMYPGITAKGESRSSGFLLFSIHMPETERELRDGEGGIPRRSRGSTTTKQLRLLYYYSKARYRVAVITTSGPSFVRVTVIGPIYVENTHSRRYNGRINSTKAYNTS